MNEFALNSIDKLLDSIEKGLNPIYTCPADARDQKLETCIGKFWGKMQCEIHKCRDSAQIEECLDYTYCKVKAYYKAKTSWYYDAYLWEKYANKKFLKITVGVYKVVEEFMKELGELYDGRI